MEKRSDPEAKESAVISDFAGRYLLRTPRCREFLLCACVIFDVLLHPFVSALRKRGCDGVGREPGVVELIGFRRARSW